MKKEIKERCKKEAEALKEQGLVYPSKKYTQTNGFCPTTDIALMSVIDKELAVLLIKRKEAPFKGSWALPGGYMDGHEDETAYDCAKRELEEETGLKEIYLEELGTFTSKGRDPREEISDSSVRIITIAHFALIDYTKVKAIAGSDAEEAKWFKISELPSLAFDHEEIIERAVERVRGKINYSNVGFELVPKKFTIPELREIFEKVLGRSLNPSNFRNKILKLNILEMTGKKRIEGKGQPAPEYKLKQESLKKLMKTGETLFN